MKNTGMLFKLNHWPRTKRLRGITRKAKQALVEANAFERQLGPDNSFHYDHWHQDWWGIGNYSLEVRQITLKAHLRVFDTLAKSALNLGKPFQIFLSLVHGDAGQDAVYLHTPNPHSAFPAEFNDCSWGVPELESLLHELLPAYQFKACRQEFNYIAFAINIGEPLDAQAQDA